MTGPDSRTGMPARLQVVLWTIIALYVLMIVWALLPMQFFALKKLGGLAIIPAIVVLAALGVTELLIVLKQARLQGLLRRSLLLIGIASIGTPVSIAMHNVVSGLLAMWFNAKEEGVFLILAIFVFPLIFLAGVAGTVASFLGRGPRLGVQA